LWIRRKQAEKDVTAMVVRLWTIFVVCWVGGQVLLEVGGRGRPVRGGGGGSRSFLVFQPPQPSPKDVHVPHSNSGPSVLHKARWGPTCVQQDAQEALRILQVVCAQAHLHEINHHAQR
jgi:hypothetical protein